MAHLSSNSARKSPFLNVKEAAVFLGVTPKTMNNFRYRGTGPAYRKHGNLVFYHIDDLNDYSRGRRYRSNGQRDDS